MINFVVSKYKQITNINLLFTLLLFISNLYLYPKLPSIVPTYFPLFGPPNNPGGKVIIWTFPLIFFVFNLIFNKNIISKISILSTLTALLKEKTKKVILIFIQIILWYLALSCYVYYYTLI